LQSSIDGVLGAALSKHELKNALGPERSELVTEDLATFLVAHYVVVTKNNSVRSIAEYFSATPDVAGCVEEILCQLEDAGLICITGDNVTFNKPHIDIGNNPEVLSRFLPRLFKISVDRLLTNAKDGVIRRNKEGLRYFVLPDNPEVASEAKALYLEYKTKMLALIEKAEKQNLKSEGIRLVGSFNCVLNPEDFA
jgi:hypothetical protein